MGKRPVLKILATAALILVTAGAEARLRRDSAVHIPPQYYTMQPPSAGGVYRDPVFGTAVERLTDEGKVSVTAPLPVVLGTVKELNEPRYPSFMGIRKANRATIPTWTAADLAIDGEVGAAASKVDWSNVYAMPAREGEVEI